LTTVPRHIQRVVARLAETEEGPDKPKTLNEQEARDLAGAFLFSGDQQEALLGDMSGGERARAALAALLACARNVLVLDEPTNHLDIPSAERLEAMLERGEGKKSGTFDGTLIVVSHDRTLIDSVCDHLIVFDGKGGVSLHMGGWSEWLAGGARSPAVPEPVKRAAPPPPPPAPAAKPKSTKSKYSWMPVEDIEKRIQELEGEVSRIDVKLDDPDVWKNAIKAAGLNAKRDEIKAELDALETEWLGRV
jgi:energy-coupling factor transporter ATP-binding protein EcfA2